MPIPSDLFASFFATVFHIDGNNDNDYKNKTKIINFQCRYSFMQLDDSYKLYLRRKYTSIFDYVEGAMSSSSTTESSKTSSSVERVGWIFVSTRPGRFVQSAKHMLVTEFCERIHLYGLRVMLVTYLHQQLHYSEKMSILIYHTFLMFVYLSCVFSKAIFMSYFNMQRCLIASCMVCITGDFLLIFGAYLRSKFITLLGLCVVGVCIGASKPIAMIVGPEQFTEDERIDMVYFLKMFYKTCEGAAIIASFCYPLLRSYLYCPDGVTCYMDIYFVGQLCLITSLVSLILARKNWRSNKKQLEQPVVTVMLCAHNAYMLYQETRLLRKEPLADFLDYSSEMYEEGFIAEIKVFRKLIYLYMSLPLFWALCYQQCSTWVLQAIKMEGDFGIFLIRPEHMQLCCIFVGMLVYKNYKYVDRWLNSFGINYRLSRVMVAMGLAAFSFLVAAFLEYNLLKHRPVLQHVRRLSKSEAELRIYNLMPCRYKFDLGDANSVYKIRTLHKWAHLFYNVDSVFTLTFNGESNDVHCPNIVSPIRMEAGILNSFFIAFDKVLRFDDNYNPAQNNVTSVARVIFNGNAEDRRHLSVRNKKNERKSVPHMVFDAQYEGAVQMLHMPFDTYYFEIDGTRITSNIKVYKGATYTILIQGKRKKGFYSSIFEWIYSGDYEDLDMTEGDDLLILYQLPQIFLMKVAESIFLNEGMTFALDHVPSSLSSVVHFLWILNVGTGQFLIICLMIVFSFESFIYWYISFAVLMFINMLLFAFLTIKYYTFFLQAKEFTIRNKLSKEK